MRTQCVRRMVVLVGLAGAVGVPGLMTACPGSAPDASNTMDPTVMATQLFQRITVTDPYQSWPQFPSAVGIVSSAAPHGDEAEIRINDAVAAAVDAFDVRLPNDSIIVKRNIGGSGEKEDALTVMWKVEGFDPANNDWFWANLALDGTVKAAGNVEGCIGCHGGARQNDFIFTEQF